MCLKKLYRVRFSNISFHADVCEYVNLTIIDHKKWSRFDIWLVDAKYFQMLIRWTLLCCVAGWILTRKERSLIFTRHRKLKRKGNSYWSLDLKVSSALATAEKKIASENPTTFSTNMPTVYMAKRRLDVELIITVVVTLHLISFPDYVTRMGMVKSMFR